MSTEYQTMQEPPEDSRALRIVVFVMALLCTVSSSYFVRTDWWMTVLYLVLIVVGSWMSYKFRHNEPHWQKYIWWVGIILVGLNALREFTGPLRDEFDYVSPFVHFLCGIFAFVTFSMKTRSDLNTASGLGLLLMVLSAPVAKGLPYGCCVLGYLTLGAVMMYYDCVSRTFTSWLSVPILPAPEIPLFKKKGRRIPRGNTILLLTVVPLLALAMFLYVPRADEFLDKLWAYTKTMKMEYLTDLFFKALTPPPPKENREHTARTWFSKNKEMKQLPMLGKYATKKEDLAKKAIDDMRKKKKKEEEEKNKKNKKKTPEIKAAEGAKEVDSTPKEDSAKKDQKKDKKKVKKGETLSKEEADKESNKVSSDLSDAEGKDKDKKDKPKDKEKQKKDEKAKEDAKPPADKPAAKESPNAKKDGKGKDGATKDGADKKGADAKDKKGEGKDGKDGKGDKGEGAGKKGKGKGKTGGGKDGAGGKNGGLEGKGGPEKPLGDATIGGDEKIGIGGKFVSDERLVLTVKSRRLVYLRRQCYDYFTGTTWKRAVPDKKVKVPDTIKVVDGEIKKEPRKIVPKPVKKVAPNPAAQYQNTVIKGSQPSVFGAGGAGVGAQQVIKGSQPSVFGNTDPNAKPADTSATTAGSQAIRSEATEAQKVTVEEEPEEKVSPFVMRPYNFETTDRPIFKVGMADALKPVETLPTVELVQEIKVKAKSIGVVVPGGWIEQELRIPSTKAVKVDGLGVITTPKPLTRGAEIKVKTELPIYPIEAMKGELPMSAKEEDSYRSSFAHYLQLPDTVSEDLFKLAEDNSDPRYNWFVQCQQICNFLRDNYEMDNERESDKESKDLVQDFLFDRKRGTAADFASAYVIMTRCVGIPSRVVNGFSPGDYNQISGEQEVKMKHRHTWAESYIPSFGWVPFDATPDGVLPSQQRENRYTNKEVGKQLGLDKPQNAWIIKWTDVAGAVVAGIISLIVGFVAFKILVALYRRWRDSMAGRGPEWRLYKRVAKAVKRSMRLVRDPCETPTEFLERVQSIIKDRKDAGKVAPEALPEALGTFLKTYSAVYFGRQMGEMEHLKYHAEQVVKVTKTVKIKDISLAESKAAVRRKNEFSDEDAAVASAVRRKKK